MSYFNSVKITDNYGFQNELSPTGELRVIIPTRTIGTSFSATPNVPDPNFWRVVNGSNSICSQANAQVTLSTQTSANGNTSLTSIRSSRYIPDVANKFNCSIRLGDSGIPNNVKRWGVFDGVDGAYFKLNNGIITICTLKGGNEISIANSAWNGIVTAPILTNINEYEIYYDTDNIWYSIGGNIAHKAIYLNGTWTNNINLPIKIDNINANNNANNTTLECRTASVSRLGQVYTLPQNGLVTTAGTYNFKYGPGVLQKIILNNLASGTSLAIYDGYVGVANTLLGTIGGLTSQATNPCTLEYMLPFQTGLMMISTGTWNATIVYE